MIARLLRWRYVVLVGWATAWMAPQYLHYRNQLSDYDVFLYGGRAMIGTIAGYHGGLHIYADHSELQIGPLPLFLAGVLSYLPGESGELIWLSLIFVGGFATVRILELLAIDFGASRTRAGVIALLAGAALLAAWTQIGFYFHLEEAAAITLVLLAARQIARRQAWSLPAICIGLAAMCKPWALATLPLVVQLDRGHRLKAALLAVASAGIWWVPFIIADTHTVTALGSLANGVMSHSTLRAFGFGFHHGGPKGVRTFEIVMGAALAALVVLREKWYAAPLVVLVARLLLEPRWYTYYTPGLMAAALAWDVSERHRAPYLMLTVGVLELVVQLWAPADVGVAAHVLLIGTIAVLIIASIRRQATEAAPSPQPELA